MKILKSIKNAFSWARTKFFGNVHDVYERKREEVSAQVEVEGSKAYSPSVCWKLPLTLITLPISVAYHTIYGFFWPIIFDNQYFWGHYTKSDRVRIPLDRTVLQKWLGVAGFISGIIVSTTINVVGFFIPRLPKAKRGNKTKIAEDLLYRDIRKIFSVADRDYIYRNRSLASDNLLKKFLQNADLEMYRIAIKYDLFRNLAFSQAIAPLTFAPGLAVLESYLTLQGAFSAEDFLDNKIVLLKRCVKILLFVKRTIPDVGFDSWVNYLVQEDILIDVIDTIHDRIETLRKGIFYGLGHAQKLIIINTMCELKCQGIDIQHILNQFSALGERYYTGSALEKLFQYSETFHMLSQIAPLSTEQVKWLMDSNVDHHRAIHTLLTLHIPLDLLIRIIELKASDEEIDEAANHLSPRERQVVSRELSKIQPNGAMLYLRARFLTFPHHEERKEEPTLSPLAEGIAFAFDNLASQKELLVAAKKYVDDEMQKIELRQTELESELLAYDKKISAQSAEPGADIPGGVLANQQHFLEQFSSTSARLQVGMASWVHESETWFAQSGEQPGYRQLDESKEELSSLRRRSDTLLNLLRDSREALSNTIEAFKQGLIEHNGLTEERQFILLQQQELWSQYQIYQEWLARIEQLNSTIPVFPVSRSPQIPIGMGVRFFGEPAGEVLSFPRVPNEPLGEHVSQSQEHRVPIAFA